MHGVAPQGDEALEGEATRLRPGRPPKLCSTSTASLSPMSARRRTALGPPETATSVDCGPVPTTASTFNTPGTRSGAKTPSNGCRWRLDTNNPGRKTAAPAVVAAYYKLRTWVPPTWWGDRRLDNPQTKPNTPTANHLLAKWQAYRIPLRCGPPDRRRAPIRMSSPAPAPTYACAAGSRSTSISATMHPAAPSGHSRLCCGRNDISRGKGPRARRRDGFGFSRRCAPATLR
jgi:hypothetical protein